MIRFRNAVALTASFILAACSSEMGHSLGGRLLKSRSDSSSLVDPRFAALKIAGAQVLLMGIEARQIGIGLRLETRRGDFTTWRAEDGVTVSLNRGMLSATRGFVVAANAPVGDLMSVDARQTQALLALRRPGQVDRFHSYVNGEGRTVFYSFLCDVTSRGPGEARIQGANRAAWVMDEECIGINAAFENTYWLDDSNRILQSRQWASPPTGFLQLQEVPQ